MQSCYLYCSFSSVTFFQFPSLFCAHSVLVALLPYLERNDLKIVTVFDVRVGKHMISERSVLICMIYRYDKIFPFKMESDTRTSTIKIGMDKLDLNISHNNREIILLTILGSR